MQCCKSWSASVGTTLTLSRHVPEAAEGAHQDTAMGHGVSFATVVRCGQARLAQAMWWRRFGTHGRSWAPSGSCRPWTTTSSTCTQRWGLANVASLRVCGWHMHVEVVLHVEALRISSSHTSTHEIESVDIRPAALKQRCSAPTSQSQNTRRNCCAGAAGASGVGAEDQTPGPPPRRQLCRGAAPSLSTFFPGRFQTPVSPSTVAVSFCA